MINKFFTVFISISLILIVVSPIIINSIDSKLIEICLENNEEEKENKSELSQEFEVDCFIIDTNSKVFIINKNSKILFSYLQINNLLTTKLTSPPPETCSFIS